MKDDETKHISFASNYGKQPMIGISRPEYLGYGIRIANLSTVSRGPFSWSHVASFPTVRLLHRKSMCDSSYHLIPTR